ncbi:MULTISPECIES: ABC transporter substrate-binding protein [unclassified Leucobacter]|uniref:ABC transporter substrate-binding protein n=1 Tax=unclassified Leucobacter TaxID=2621730 RepID=UPI000A07C80D|nr:ABC transporter substrate-binding protein [Leucobacter sp. Ag1]
MTPPPQTPDRSRHRRPGRTATTATASAALIAVLAVAGLAGCSSSGSAASAVGDSSTTKSPFDLSTKNLKDRPHIEPVPEAVAALKESGFTPVQSGKLTVALGAYVPPTSFLAEDDNRTFVGSDPDIANLIADGLGLKFAPENVAWADWPLGIESGKYDLGVTNITVTEERKDLFDFATYRQDVVAFEVKKGSKITKISKAADVSGLKVVVGSGTNQEKILLNWFAENTKAGLPPGEPVYYEDQAAAGLALSSGRVDAILGPNAAASFRAATTGQSTVVGTLNGGYPATAEIGATTKKGNGLAKPVQIVLNHLIKNGEYDTVLKRWATEAEAIPESRINPPGLPRP